MRSIPVLLKLIVVFTLIPLLPSCGTDEQSSDSVISRKVKQKKSDETQTSQKPPKDRRVTLKPPYREWGWRGPASEAKLTIIGAISAVTKQAGIGYRRSISYENTYPTCIEWVHPDFENKPWKEAVEEILEPFDLAYVMASGDLVLMTPRDAEKRSLLRQEVSDKISLITSSDIPPPRLRDAVIVFPLLDSSGRTTELGTLLSELGLLKATYTPKKTFNLHVPSLIDLYRDKGYDTTGMTIHSKEREKIMKRFNATDHATGKLTTAPDGLLEISLNFHGRSGNKDFSTVVAKDDIISAPQWIARRIFDYCQLEPSPEQETFLSFPEYRDTTAFSRLVELESDYRNGNRNRAGWRRFLKSNPEAVLALYRYYTVTARVESEDSLRYLAAAYAGYGGHDLMKFLEADGYYRSGDCENSILHLLELLERDLQNYQIYIRLCGGLRELDAGKDAVALCEFWKQHDSDSYLPYLAEGNFFRSYAWDARGSSWARTVSEEDWKIFYERLHTGEKSLIRAFELNPTDPRAAASLIIIAKALSQGRSQMEKWFEKAMEADSQYYDAYVNKLTYLMPKWGGSREEMFAFARKSVKNSPNGSPVALLLADAHYEMASRSADGGGKWADYFKDPKVWNELQPLYEEYLMKHPYDVKERNYYAKVALFSERYEEAARQFKIIGDDFDMRCWQSEKNFKKFRNKAYRAARTR